MRRKCLDSRQGQDARVTKGHGRLGRVEKVEMVEESDAPSGLGPWALYRGFPLVTPGYDLSPLAGLLNGQAGSFRVLRRQSKDPLSAAVTGLPMRRFNRWVMGETRLEAFYEIP